MNLNEYFLWCRKVWRKGKGATKRFTADDKFVMCTGLGGETGEVLEVLKKQTRDKAFNRDDLVKEMGDVLYYMMMICHWQKIDPQELMDGNVDKLQKRYAKRAKKR